MNDATDQIVVADTDIGFDADDAVAIAILARAPIDTLLVATADETGGRRARLLRRLLGLLGRDDVTVFTGLSCPETRAGSSSTTNSPAPHHHQGHSR
ncbi:hypothetical protein [Nocardia cyriacigeorgica]|uniref:hypothetical protein n=1 Tax=Nocardia cyriacigeorgica TaxID=135487 RepID=UPI001894A291|nr:hypothetical protein [Nocardia cyriacigeorgica]MBF6325835.1 hypothetical protein [Nocardia cyriacigeorgica]